MNILIIAPHPDDEVLGVGGTIAKHVQMKDKVFLCVVTKAYTPDWSKEFIEKRNDEIKASNKILCIAETYFLDYPTVKLDTIPQKELNDKLRKIIDKTQPDVLYIPSISDINKDHRIIHESCLVVSRPYCSKIIKILAYETLSETEWGLFPFIPNYYINITNFIDIKVEAFKAYKSEVRKSPHPRSLELIKVLCRKRGSEVGYEFAEAFILIRQKEN